MVREMFDFVFFWVCKCLDGGFDMLNFEFKVDGGSWVFYKVVFVCGFFLMKILIRVCN